MPVLLAAFLAHPTTLFALANLKHDLGKLWAWLCHRSFWQLMFGAALILAGWEYIGKRAEQRHAHKVETQLSKCTAGRKADRDTYVKAQTDATTANKLQVAAKEAQSRKVSDDEKNAYARDHAELVRMRAQRDAAAKRAASSAAAPKDGTAGPESDGHGMPLPAGDDVQKTRDDAADIELRLMHLQNYVEQQLTIDPNGK